jgi:8-amino-7-oxononanoate synthase
MDVFGKCRGYRDDKALKDMGLYPYFKVIQGRPAANEIVCGGRRILMAGSNDYLALATDPRLISAATAALRRHGTGNSGSRVTNGTLALHEELEGRLAEFLGHQAAIVTSTGYQANLALAPLFGTHDVLLADRSIHASFLDAVRLGKARLIRFRHNDMTQLSRLLNETAPETSTPAGGRLIATEGMFSTSGDLCDLPGIAKLAQQHGARVALDGAHDIGLIGDNGRGAAEYYGLQSAVDLHTLTFSKCFGTIGGAVAGPDEVIRYLRHHAHSTVFTASLPAGDTAAALAALDIIRTEPERRRRVLATAEHLGAELDALGFTTTRAGTPTIPVHVGDALLCFQFWTELFNEGVFTNAMVPPGVPEGESLIRVSVTAAHTRSQIDRILQAFATTGRRLHLIG